MINARDTLLINYQGRLTDTGGEPVTGTPSIAFTIYDGSGVSATAQWSETHPAVTVTEGLFSVVLGTVTPLPDSVFNGDDRYLGIAVSVDPEIFPRSLLTSAPGAAYTRKMIGDLTTEAGAMVMRSSEGVDSAIVMTADDLASKIKIGMSIPPDPVRPGLEMGADELSNYLKVNWMTPTNQYEPAFEVSSDVNEGIKIKLSMPPDDIKPSFEVSSDASGEKIRMKLAIPPDDHKPVFDVEADAVAERVKMVLGIPPDPYAPAFEFSSSPTDGAGMNIYDEIGQVMGLDPSPFNQGYSMTLYDPTQMTETPLISLGTDYSGSSEARFRMFSSQATEPSAPEIEMLVSEGLNRFTFGLATPPDDIKPGMELTSNTTTATMMMGGGPGGYSGQQYITLTTDQTSAKIGIGTDTPAEALDVRGTAEVEGFKMATGASDGYVLTSDGDGNGTWQASGGPSKLSCAGTENKATTGTGTCTVNFPVTFPGDPYLSVSAIVLSGANAGKVCYVTNITFSGPSEPEVNAASFDVQYHDGAAWTDVGGSIQVQIAYTAIEQ